ncbi:MAG: hypothetical protein ACT4OK_11160 [Gemmobacter sp.]
MPYDRDDDYDRGDDAVSANNDLAAHWQGEEITVALRARSVLSDYGVPGSPVFSDIEDVEIDSLSIFGVAVDPNVPPKDLQDHLLGLADDVEWEQG